MTDLIEIRGGASAFEAAVIGVVLDAIADAEATAERAKPDQALSAWVRAANPEEPDVPTEIVIPD